MTDAYLISKLGPEHHWLSGVYERTAGYIHCSGAHLLSPIAEVRNESREVEYVIGETGTEARFRIVELPQVAHPEVDSGHAGMRPT